MGHANVFVHATSFLYSVVGNTRHRLMTGQSWKCQSLLVLDLLIIGKVCWYMQIAKVHYRFFFRKKLASPGAEAEEAWGRLKCARALARLFLATVGATHHLATPAASRSVGLAGSCWRMRLDACRSICKFLPWRIFLIFFNLFFFVSMSTFFMFVANFGEIGHWVRDTRGWRSVVRQRPSPGPGVMMERRKNGGNVKRLRLIFLERDSRNVVLFRQSRVLPRWTAPSHF